MRYLLILLFTLTLFGCKKDSTTLEAVLYSENDTIYQIDNAYVQQLSVVESSDIHSDSIYVDFTETGFGTPIINKEFNAILKNKNGYYLLIEAH